MLSSAVYKFLETVPTDIYFVYTRYHYLQALVWAMSQPPKYTRHVIVVFQDWSEGRDMVKPLIGVTGNICIIPLYKDELIKPAEEGNSHLLQDEVMACYKFVKHPDVRVHVTSPIRSFMWTGRMDMILHDSGPISYLRDERTGNIMESDIWNVLYVVLCNELADRDENRDRRILYWDIKKSINELSSGDKRLIYSTFAITDKDQSFIANGIEYLPLEERIKEMENVPPIIERA